MVQSKKEMQPGTYHDVTAVSVAAQATKSNVSPQSHLLWVHMVSVWIISFYAFWVRPPRTMPPALHVWFACRSRPQLQTFTPWLCSSSQPLASCKILHDRLACGDQLAGTRMLELHICMCLHGMLQPEHDTGVQQAACAADAEALQQACGGSAYSPLCHRQEGR